MLEPTIVKITVNTNANDTARAGRLRDREEQAADFLKMPRPKFRGLAASGEFIRVSYGEKSYRYYAYDLLDWALAKRAI